MTRDLHHRLKTSIDKGSGHKKGYRFIQDGPRPKANIRPAQSNDKRGEDIVNARLFKPQEERPWKERVRDLDANLVIDSEMASGVQH